MGLSQRLIAVSSSVGADLERQGVDRDNSGRFPIEIWAAYDILRVRQL
jgi:hypothetical protein